MKNVNVLLVEDNEINQIVASALLRRWGLGVTIAKDGKEALTLVQTKAFHLILMDLQMPEMDGYESTSHIRAIQDEYFKTIPIIAFSASSMISSRESAMAVGMTDFVHKPLVAEELQGMIDTYVFPEKKSQNELVLSVDFEQLSEGDIGFKYELINLFADNIRELKLSLTQALHTNESSVFTKTCHKVATTLEILNVNDLNDMVHLIKNHLAGSTMTDIKTTSRQFSDLCDRIVRALNQELSHHDKISITSISHL